MAYIVGARFFPPLVPRLQDIENALESPSFISQKDNLYMLNMQRRSLVVLTEKTPLSIVTHMGRCLKNHSLKSETSKSHFRNILSVTNEVLENTDR